MAEEVPPAVAQEERRAGRVTTEPGEIEEAEETGAAKGAQGVLALSVGDAFKVIGKKFAGLLQGGITGKIITVDIDDSTIRIVETRRGEVKKWASLAIPAPTEEETGAPPDPRGLSALIKQTMASAGIKTNRVVASISGLYSVNRFVPLTSLPQRPTLQESVSMVIKETMPLTEDKLYFSWYNLPVSQEQTGRVLILGVPRNVVDYRMRALKNIGISPRSLEPRAMALARVVGREQAVILNIEPTSFNIIIVINNVPEVMRTIAWESSGLGWDEKAEHLATSLELTRDYFNGRHPGLLNPDTPLFITGQLSGDLPLVDRLRARVNCPVESLAPPLQCPAHLPVSQFAVNLGLAMKGVVADGAEGGQAQFDVNILPEAYRPWRPSAKQVYSTVLIVAAIALVFPLFQLTTDAMGKTADLQRQFNAIDTQLQIKSAEIKRREPLQKATNEYKQILDLGGNITADLEIISGEAQKLGVKVVSVTHEGIKINVDAEAPSYTAFREYIAALEKNGRFSSPVPPPEGYPYTTKGTIKLESRSGQPVAKVEPAKPAATTPAKTTTPATQK